MNQTQKKPNIILIMCDQLRGDSLGIAGHPDVKTPYIDTLALDGTYFSKAYSATPSCIPARAALLTGQSQKRHGRVGYQDGVPWNYSQMFPALLAKADYHTECIGKMHVHPPLRACGFQNLRLHDGYLGYYRNPKMPYREHQLAHDRYLMYLKEQEGYHVDITDTGIEANSWIARPWPYREASHPTNWVVNEALDFLQYRDEASPFLLKLSFVRPHPPWDAPEPFFAQYDPQQLAEPVVGDWADLTKTEADGRRYNSSYGCVDETVRKQGMAGYYACITHIDHQIGRFLEGLEQERLLEDSVIIFTSDHGEMLFDHHLFRKVVPYEGSTHIPLIVRVGKNILQNEKLSKENGGIVELRDIAPTILEFAGVPIPETMDGKSLVPLLYNKKARVREFLHGEHSGSEEISNHYIVTEKEKFIWFSQSGKEQFFDLEKDPLELREGIKAPEYQSRIQQLRSLLVEELDGREEGYSDGARLLPGRPAQKILTQVLKEKADR